MSSLEELEREIAGLKGRNARVEADKAWETSGGRRILVAVLTYAVIVVFFLMARLPRPFLNALVPAAAFLLSTVTLGAAKRAWLRGRK